MTKPYDPDHGISGQPYSAPAGDGPAWLFDRNVDPPTYFAQSRAGYQQPNNIAWPNTLPPPQGPEVIHPTIWGINAPDDPSQPDPVMGGDGGGGRKRSWFARHKILTALLALVALFLVFAVIGAIAGPGPSAPAVALPTASQVQPAPPAPKPSTQPSVAPVPPVVVKKPVPPKAAPKPPLTTGQEQAVGAAKDYLDTSAFSRLGLIDQLSSAYGSGFSKADSTFAVDYLHVDWKAQAVLAAKEYLDSGHFSRAGMIEQLSSPYGSRFTRAQATYAADKVGL